MPNYRDIGTSSGRSRTTSRIPAVVNTHVNKFSGANISNRSSNLKNCIATMFGGEPDRLYVTQRPSISIIEDASDTGGVGTKGRGIYYWDKKSLRVFVNDDTIYTTNYATAVTVWTNGDTEQTGLVSGAERVYFIEWSSANEDYLFIISPEASQIFVIQGSDTTEAVNLKDLVDDSTGDGISGDGLGLNYPLNTSDAYDFTGMPIHSDAHTGSTATTMAHGAVVLDKYMFLGYTNGKIYDSAVDDFLDWPALNFLTAERENDKLLVLTKSKDHIVALGERTIELMYDAANPTGSPLTPRTDIFYNIGTVSGQTVWVDGDDIYVLGMKPQGDFSLFILRDFQLEEIHDETLNSYLKHGRTEASVYSVLSGLSTGSHTYAILTIYNGTDNTSQISLVYDDHTKLWYEWSTDILDINHFCLVDWAVRTTSTPITAEGIWCNGDLFTLLDNFTPLDQVAATAGYFGGDYDGDDTSSGYDEAGTAATSTNIAMEVIIGNLEMESSDRKFMHSVDYVGNQTQNTQTITVSWTDDDEATWHSATIDPLYRTQINRLGSFTRRKFKIAYAGDEQLRMEGLDATYTKGIS